MLDVGTGSGYQAAVLAELAAEVHSIERIPELAERAQENLAHAGYVHVHVHVGDGTRGLPEYAPYGGWAKASDGVVSDDGKTASTVDGGGFIYLDNFAIRKSTP